MLWTRNDDHLGKKLVVEITPTVVKRYQTDRLAEKAGPKTINDEVLLLLRLCGDQGDSDPRAFAPREGDEAGATRHRRVEPTAPTRRRGCWRKPQKLRSKNMYPALVLDLNCGLRDKELRELRWEAGRPRPQEAAHGGQVENRRRHGARDPAERNGHAALQAHAAWYIRRFGECKPEWYVFPAGKASAERSDPPVTSFKTAWIKVRQNAKVVGRWHDNRHTLVTELAESGAGDEVIMSIAGHVSRAMLSRYSHVRMEAKRRALDEIATRQRAADEKRKKEAEQKPGAALSRSALLQ
jgi:integrase